MPPANYNTPPQAPSQDFIAHLVDSASSLPPPLVFALGSASAVIVTLLHRRFLKRFRNGDWITPDVFMKKRWVRGIVTSVGDADNFRLYHTPGLGWRWPLRFRNVPSTPKGRKDQTIHIRLAGVDAPEGSHFGRPAQPYSAESLAWLKSQIGGKSVLCQLLRRDQYFRIVAIVVTPGFFPSSRRNLSLEMLRAGWATTYEQSNAEYGRWDKEHFLSVEAEARKKRRGMWKDGVPLETPAQYKRRYAAASETEKPTEPNPIGRQSREASPNRRWWNFWRS